MELRTLSALILFPAAGCLFATTIRVPADQPGIQSAINAAAPGDTVSVAPGTYRENIDFLGKAITVVSEQGPAQTVIDGGAIDSVAKFISGEGHSSILSGFTLQNGLSTFSTPGFGDGGGVWIRNAAPTLRNNIIVNNRSCSGAGIFVRGGSPLISGNTISRNTQYGCSGGTGGGGIGVVSSGDLQILNNVIEENSVSSADGGGIALFSAGTPTIDGNVIRNNVASGVSPCSAGGGIAMANYSDALITNNLIVGNSAGCGGGIRWLVPSGARGPYIVNNTLVGNTAGQGAAVYAAGYQAQAQVVNNIVVSAASTAAVYCDGAYGNVAPAFAFNDVYATSGSPAGGICSGLVGSNGNISADPMFESPAGDFHLRSGSLAIDSGTPFLAPAQDIEARPRPLDGNGDGAAVFDLGAYEAPAVDVTPPATTALVAPQAGLSGWNTSSVTVTLTATDALSPVQQVEYSLSGAQTAGPVAVKGASVTFPIAAEGFTTVTYFAVDAAGNTESAHSSAVRIDKTPPVISGMPPVGCTLSPAKHQLVQVASVAAADALSGLTSLTVTATSNQPDSGTGGGDVAGDVVINGGLVQLRAEKSPGAGTRIYTVKAVARDVAGNSAAASATCTVK